jgi:hypothetical protein
MGKALTSISIPTSLFKRIQDLKDRSEGESAEEYIIRIIEEKLSVAEVPDEELSQDDEEKIKERLKALGYLD